MKKFLIIITTFITLFTLLGCEKEEATYESSYTLDNVLYMDIHYSGGYVLYQLDNDNILLHHGSPIDMFSTYDSNNLEQHPMEFVDITDEIPLKVNEEIIKIADFGMSISLEHGYLFLTNLGNVYTYHLGDKTFDDEFYISGNDNNLIQLEDGEVITNLENYDNISSTILRFTTNLDNEFVFERNIPNIGNWYYDISFFESEETLLNTAFVRNGNRMLLLTSEQTVYLYTSSSGEHEVKTDFFPTNNNEEIVNFVYQQGGNVIYYVTSQGRFTKIDLEDIPTVHNTLNLDLTDNEIIIDIQQSQSECNEAYTFIETSGNNYYIAEFPKNVDESIDLDVKQIDFHEILEIPSTTVIEDIIFSDFVINPCVRSIPYTRDNVYMVYTFQITTKDNTYFIGYDFSSEEYFSVVVK